ncbi:WxL domain-containing protein [Enterococcus canis]|nr:WxL domain-containing protein [Enterococcus canis]
MKKFGIALFFFAMLIPTTAFADATRSQGGKVEFEDKQVIYDPENPSTPVSPEGGIKENTNPLRLDYVPALNFGSQQAKVSDPYSAIALSFLDDTSARAHFVQITDNRGTAAGWTLGVKQETQFRTVAGDELDGAMLSLGHTWVNSIQTEASTFPNLKNDTINMKIGEEQEIATANQGKGEGTWLISFGRTSLENFKPLMDENDNPILHPESQKPLYENGSVTLTVPEKTVKKIGIPYKTELTWILSDVPKSK